MKKLVLFLSLLSTGAFITNCSSTAVSQNSSSLNSVEATSSTEVSLERFSSSNSSSASSQRSSSSNSSRKSTSSREGYAISHTSAIMTMGDELQLSITFNGTKVSSVSWSSSDNQLARVEFVFS